MCWTIQISLLSAVCGWVTCGFLLWRQRSFRDRWYAQYLFTFTLTQLVDIALWSLHETEGYRLQACPDRQLALPDFSVKENPQFWNYAITKLLIPVVVFTQNAVQCTYPRPGHKTPWRLIALQLFPCALLCFAFGCTIIGSARFPVLHDTLRWGGDFIGSGENFSPLKFWLNQVGAILQSAWVVGTFVYLMPRRVAVVHTVVLGAVMTTLAVTEGRLDYGSKWCTYCLIYSAVYAAEPLWYPAQKKHEQ